MAGASAWRVNDVVFYELMRAASADLAGELLRRASRDDAAQSDLRMEAGRLGNAVAEVDVFDRSAVAALAGRIDQRRRELESGSR